MAEPHQIKRQLIIHIFIVIAVIAIAQYWSGGLLKTRHSDIKQSEPISNNLVSNIENM